MPVFAWKPEYTVSNTQLDGHHKHLFQLVDGLQSAMAAGKGKSAMDATLQELITYTQSHFAAEERLMELSQYPDLPRHKAEHEALTEKVVEFKREYDAGRATITLQLLQFLRDWLQTHIMKSDRAYAPYIGDAELGRHASGDGETADSEAVHSR